MGAPLEQEGLSPNARAYSRIWISCQLSDLADWLLERPFLWRLSSRLETRIMLFTATTDKWRREKVRSDPITCHTVRCCYKPVTTAPRHSLSTLVPGSDTLFFTLFVSIVLLDGIDADLFLPPKKPILCYVGRKCQWLLVQVAGGWEWNEYKQAILAVRSVHLLFNTTYILWCLRFSSSRYAAVGYFLRKYIRTVHISTQYTCGGTNFTGTVLA
jgi:hypothetical protein